MAIWLPTFKLDCRACSEEEKRENGCREDSPIPDVWELDGWMFQRCPASIITVQTGRILRAYTFFKLGFLPYSGGWLEQPAKFISAIEIIEREIKKAKKEINHDQ
ncbi:MAG: hypothetical protein ABIH47_09145 [Candidatus Omnitrophota bacterium]